MVILIDMDNVVADLMTKWLGTYNAEYNDNLVAEDIVSWNIETFAKKCSPNEFHNIITRAEFFADLAVFEHAIEVTARLQEAGHELYFVTATPYDNPTGGYDKYNWVEKNFPHIGKTHVIQAHHKHMIRGDVLFDDGPINLKNFPNIKIAMDFPYNRNIPVNYRVNNWLEFENCIKQIDALRNQLAAK